MNTEDKIKENDPLAAVFLEKFKDHFPSLNYEWAGEEPPHLAIHAIHPDVGPIDVWFDGDELTIGIGEYFHTHFSLYDYEDLPEEQQWQASSDEAVRFIDDFISERIILSIKYFGGEPRSASIFYEDDPEHCSTIVPAQKDSPKPASKEIKEIFYKWSGLVNQGKN
jgi:hypothetical protein